MPSSPVMRTTGSLARLVPWLVPLLLLAVVPCVPADAAAGSPRRAVYKVPKKIKDDCSVAVDGQISSWLATVPDGSTVQFAGGRCYGQDGTITLTGRKHLVIDGGGSEFRALTLGDSHRANWRLVGGGDLTLRNMAVRGSDPGGVYQPGFEWQHGYSVEGVQGMTLSGVAARETWGDGVYLGHSSYSPACGDDASSARDVVIDGATVERSGRQGLAVVDAENVTLQGSTIGPVGWWNVDLETDDDCEIARHVTIAGNSFGASRYGAIGSVGYGAYPQVGDVQVTDNVQTAPGAECWASVWILSPDGVYRRDYTFARNRFLARGNAFEFRRVSNVAVSSNSVTFDRSAGCTSRVGVLLVDSHTVGITGNVFSGADQVFTSDALSRDITSSDNSLN